MPEKKIQAKSQAKKSPAVKKNPKAKKNPALDELVALLPELDDEGIVFLLEQAKVHHYNMEVERLNAITERAAAGGAAKAPQEAAQGALRIERSADGTTYHLVAGGDWKMFTAEEMASLVRITRSGEAEGEIARRLRSWFARERKDVFLDLGLDGPSIGMAKDIAALIVKTFPSRP